MTYREAYSLLELFVQRCSRRALADPCNARAWERAAHMELELVRQEALKEVPQSHKPPKSVDDEANSQVGGS